jgi:hypothetical protein
VKNLSSTLMLFSITSCEWPIHPRCHLMRLVRRLACPPLGAAWEDRYISRL